MMDLTKDEEFEIEKCLDIQRGWLTDRIMKACELATHMSGLGRKTHEIDKLIMSLTESKENYGRISRRFEEERKKVSNHD